MDKLEKVIGVLGGGQLGRMLTEAANHLNVKVITLDVEASPAKQVNAHGDHVSGSFRDAEAIQALAKKCDVLTVEIEHVNTAVLEQLEYSVEVQPSWRTLRVIQDKLLQKKHLSVHQIDTVESVAVQDRSAGALKLIGQRFGYPFMLKSRTEAYDGRGNCFVTSAADITDALGTLGERPLYAERLAWFKAELAVMVVKTVANADVAWETSTVAYPVVETEHEDNICKMVYAPARGVAPKVLRQASDLARRAVATFWGRGVFGVEMFLLNDGEFDQARFSLPFAVFRCFCFLSACFPLANESDELLVNEIAPRPHNSGHYTIEACPISQYEAQIAAVLGLPIPEWGTKFKSAQCSAVMLNILGGLTPTSHLRVLENAWTIPGRSIHMYGKGEGRPGRKMGHVTVIADSLRQAELAIEPLVRIVDEIRQEWRPKKSKTGSTRAGNIPTNNKLWPLVAVTMGSDSDLEVLRPGLAILTQLQISHYVTITSAHRSPQRMFAFAATAEQRGIKVIIAAAGGAAHLPGMLAAITPLPVIGIPVKGKSLDGLDSVLSILQMPVSFLFSSSSSSSSFLSLFSYAFSYGNFRNYPQLCFPSSFYSLLIIFIFFSSRQPVTCVPARANHISAVSLSPQ